MERRLLERAFFLADQTLMRFTILALTDRGQCQWESIETVSRPQYRLRRLTTMLPVTKSMTFVRMLVFDDEGREIRADKFSQPVHMINGDSLRLTWDIRIDGWPSEIPMTGEEPSAVVIISPPVTHVE